MDPRKITLLPSIFVFLYFSSTSLPCLRHGGHHHTNGNNITVIGTVFCDICSNNTFTKHSYFLTGAKVEVKCSLRTKVTAKEEILITADRTTDQYGIYRVDIPPVDGFKCREGREIESFCQARLIESSSLACDVPGLSTSAEHMAVNFTQSNLCIYNLNALNYRPQKKDYVLCGGIGKKANKPKENSMVLGNSNPKHELNSSLFFWPPFTSWPFPHWPYPFPCPFQFPFPFPLPWSPPPPAFPWPFPPLGFLPSPPPPPSFSFPFPPFGSIPVPFTPSPPPLFPPPPFFPFPFAPFTPIPFTPQTPPPPLPPSPPQHSFPFPFPHVQVSPPETPSPPTLPPGFSFTDPRTWYLFPPPINPPPAGDP